MAYVSQSSRHRPFAVDGQTSGDGPPRHFAAKQRFGRFRMEADISWRPKPARSVENDPSRTFETGESSCGCEKLLTSEMGR